MTKLRTKIWISSVTHNIFEGIANLFAVALMKCLSITPKIKFVSHKKHMFFKKEKEKKRVTTCEFSKSPYYHDF